MLRPASYFAFIPLAHGAVVLHPDQTWLQILLEENRSEPSSLAERKEAEIGMWPNTKPYTYGR
jgi:hypothetical protein